MAENIRILGNINEIKRITRLKGEDANLLYPSELNQNFGFKDDYIEFFVFNLQGTLLHSDYSYRNFTVPYDNSFSPDTSLLPAVEIDPITDLKNLGYVSGQFVTRYNFQKAKLSKPSERTLFISKISQDRTEVAINSISFSIEELLTYGDQLVNEINNSTTQKSFLLNLSPTIQSLVVNVFNSISTGEIFLKLYEPLPNTIRLKDRAYLTEEIIDPYLFDINIDAQLPIPVTPYLKRANFDLELDISQNKGTGYETYSSILSSLTGSSYQNVLNYMKNNSYDLNIDYTSFSNFVHFSSAEKRLNVFYDKIKSIERLNYSSSVVLSSSYDLASQLTSSFKTQIDNIVSNFDGFESYLYFESSSYTYPKLGSNRPYTLLPSTASAVINWFNNYTGSAETYDQNNLDHLYYSLPGYIKNDPVNYQPYFDFIDMIGHYFDNIWIYISSINDLYDADNNLEKGVSKDIVYDALSSLGVKLYNSKKDEEYDKYVYGLNSGSALFTDDFTTGSAYLNNIPKKDLLAETYKRIYHNIPLISKQKGTSVGLQNLVNTFGVTSSIFLPKEFGGSTKKNQIKGYDNDKITIQNNTITGSVLSPFISVQNTPTSSAEFTSMDLHFVDLSFSPQNELNSRISASIASNNPTFSLDEYIGDPRLMSSSSYDALIYQKDFYISASSAPSGSAKRLDYKGFFELIKYFDNSLFKMLKDFIPARTTPLTGITIKSPVLERNKIPQHSPKFDSQPVYEANYGAPVISEDKDYHYEVIGDNKTAFYNGELTGSYLNVYSYFDDEHPNPYLIPTESIDINKFNHSDFNVTLNSVSSSVESVSRKKLEKKYTTSNNKVFSSGSDIINNIELQDSNLSLQGHTNSRYDGTKISSLTYNKYNDGDTSFGKTAVIDSHTRKLGLFTQIQQNSLLFYPKRTNVFLKYLVDENGNLTELNKTNKNWFEIQNIFKSGELLNVAQFDSQKYADNKMIDGDKKIYSSGYSYSPILYGSAANDANLYFEYVGDSLSKLFKINLVGGYLNGNSTITYPIIGDKVFSLFSGSIDTFDDTYNNGNIFYANAANTFPTYSIQESGQQRFNANFFLRVEVPSSGLSGSFTCSIDEVGGNRLISQSLSFNSSYYSTMRTNYTFGKKVDDSFTFTLTRTLTVNDIAGNFIKNINSGTVFRKLQAGPSIYNCSFPTSNVYYVTDDYYRSALNTLAGTCTDIYSLPLTSSGNFLELYTEPVDSLVNNLYFNLTSDYTYFTPTDKVALSFTTGSSNTTNFTASITGYNSDTGIGTFFNQLAESQVGTNPIAPNTVPYISGSRSGNLILSGELSYFYNYLFTPSGSNITQNTKFQTYGEAQYTFTPKTGDIIGLFYDDTYFESEIESISFDADDKLNLALIKDLPSALNKSVYASGDIDSFVFLSKLDDETNLILQLSKDLQFPTSLGLIIPNDLHPDVLARIDVITKEVKQKLIDISPSTVGGF